MITVNLTQAKLVAHTRRRDVRNRRFAPLDAVIAKQIPGVDITAVEAQRQAIRDEDAALQVAIDAASSVTELKALWPALPE